MKGRGLVVKHRLACTRLLPVLLATCVLAACGQAGSPIEEATPDVGLVDRTPVVLVPGVSREVGSELRGGRYMPFSVLALRTDAEALARLGDPRFPVGGGTPLALSADLDRALRQTEVRGLQGLINRLIREDGYLRGDPEHPLDKNYPENPEAARSDRTRPASLFVVYYDWRRDIAESACFLANRVARIRARTGASRVLVVGHSLGGVVARYYARYGGRDVMSGRECPLATDAPASVINAPGARGMDGLVTLGAPHQGSVQAFRALLQDFNLWGVFSVGLRSAVFTMPLAWQLLPFAGSDGGVSLLAGNNGIERVALFDPQVWITRGWVVGDPADPERRQFLGAMLQRARVLHQRLQEPSPAEEAVTRLALGSTCVPTPALAMATDGGVEFLSRFQGDHPMFGRVTVPGDGVVSLDSALGLPTSATLATMTVCTGHSAYANDPSVTDRIAQLVQR